MGLDMVLYADLRISDDLADKIRGMIYIPFKSFELEKLRIEIIRWRKVNAIHNWFVVNCAEGVDDCMPIDVSIEQLIKLRNICQKVLDHSKLIYSKEFVRNVIEDPSYAKIYLPTKDGYYFGTLEYDAWYYQDIEYTLDELNKILAIPAGELSIWKFVYKASW